MINPVNHSRSREDIAVYKVELYVMPADIYAVTPHTGPRRMDVVHRFRGLDVQVIVESLLGLRLEVDKLHFTPCFPAHWTGFKVHYRFRETVYHITVLQTPDHIGEMTITMDGLSFDGQQVQVTNDLKEHFVELTFAPAESTVSSI